MAVTVSLGTVRNLLFRRDPSGIGNAESPCGRPYWCEACDVYGKGADCWSCGSTDVVRNQTARRVLPV
jgi:hypothetical protein